MCVIKCRYVALWLWKYYVCIYVMWFNVLHVYMWLSGYRDMYVCVYVNDLVVKECQ